MNTEQEPQAQAQPDWSESETAPGELWKNRLRPMAENLLVADGAIHHRDLVIKNLRQQLAKKDAALNACVEAMENIKSDYAAHDGKRWDIDDAITQAEKALK